MSVIHNKPLDASESSPSQGGASFSIGNRAKRLLWQLTWGALASWTPSILWPWRNYLLRLFGAKLSKRCDVRGGAKVWLPENLTMGEGSIIASGAICYNQAPVRIGRNVVISQRAHLCAGGHDIDDPNFQLVAKPIEIEDDAWVAAEAFVGSGSYIARGSVLGARAVCLGALQPWTVYVGNPCSPLRTRKHTGSNESTDTLLPFPHTNHEQAS